LPISWTRLALLNSFSMISIPERLLINGREPVQEFDPAEKLYFRFQVNYFSGSESRIPVAAIKFPDFSVNRELFSAPSDVLIPHWLKWGIVEIREGGVPKSLPVSQQGKAAARTVDFQTIHDPIGVEHEYFPQPTQQFENYAHCEIRAFESGERLTQDIPKSVKKLFRTKLSDSSDLCQILLDAL